MPLRAEHSGGGSFKFRTLRKRRNSRLDPEKAEFKTRSGKGGIQGSDTGEAEFANVLFIDIRDITIKGW